MPVPHYDAEAIAAATVWSALIAAIGQAFAAPHVAPDRHVHEIAVPGRAGATALLMPAWIEGAVYGVKLANIFPSNGGLGLPSVHALYVLFDATTGAPLATMDGGALTVHRTAATSAFASKHLSRPESSRLLMIGAGRMAPMLIAAHRAVRPIEDVMIWARDPTRAAVLAAQVGGRAVANLDAALAEADIVSAATLCRAPLIKGALLKPGTHVDLVGAFSPTMREADGETIARAQIFIDTLGGARAEAGDLIQAAAEGKFDWGQVCADLADLASGRHAGRRDEDEITLFKSVGAAIEDLAAARLVMATGEH